MTKPVKLTRCRYCGARLRRDFVGQYCPTKNCQWNLGLPVIEDVPRKLNGKNKHGT